MSQNPAGGEEEYYSDSADEWEAPINMAPVEGGGGDGGASGRPLPPGRASQLNPSNDVERELAGDPVPVVFALPDGRTAAQTFFMGHTVEFLKSWLEETQGLRYERTTLFLGERQMLDPLSLNDLPVKPKETNNVRVVLSPQ